MSFHPQKAGERRLEKKCLVLNLELSINEASFSRTRPLGGFLRVRTEQADFTIPTETIHVAQAAFPKGNIYMRMRDELGVIYDEKVFANLFQL